MTSTTVPPDSLSFGEELPPELRGENAPGTATRVADVLAVELDERSATTTRPRSLASRDGRVLTCAGYDNAIRWRPGERLEQLFEQRCDALRQHGRADHLAVDGPDATLSYAELDGRANQLARYLVVRQGVRPGDRVGLLFDRAVDTYVGMLAVLKLHAAYVPLDAAFPPDRLSYIVSDARVRVVLSRSHLNERLAALDIQVQLLNLDETEGLVARQRQDCLEAREVGAVVDDLCYVIYTSGTTGRPKGVAISHASVCNFVRVGAEVYGITADDRLYQGLTIAFDFSVEEIWIAWMVGATLVPKPSGVSLLGSDLDTFLRERRVTALCCVPTLLATLERDLPDLRFLLVSGESCSQDLVTAWSRPDRRFLNVYGPTEATVTATWTLMQPDRPVTIGVPLPTYSIVILDPDAERALPPGEVGEIGIAGIGLADGYLNRADLTERAFVPDFLGLPENPSGRIYRTGDLGRVNDDGEIEFFGRVDAQVKIRGYRVELAEIESVLRQVPAIGQAVVTTYQPEPNAVELVAYYSLRSDTAAVDVDQVYDHLRDRLPAYMVPAYLEELAELPVMTTGKTDRTSLPAPTHPRRLVRQGGLVLPATETESVLADQLANILGVERISVDSHFFDDLGADSLVMARFSAAIRKGVGDLAAISMRDVYLHPTVRRLAAALAEAGSTVPSESVPVSGSPEPSAPIGKPRYYLCGALQLLTFLGYAGLAAVLLNIGAGWLAAGHGLLSLYLRAVVFGGGVLLGLGLVPIVAKWTLIGRWKPQRIRVWSMAYLRFWVVKTLVVANPTARLCVGTPLYGLYLRALGAKIGRGAVIHTHHLPVCTDMLSVGRDSVIRKDTHINGYRARSGVIETGAITLGENVFVGEQSILDIDTALGDGAQLGHSSSLHQGQFVPAGQRWHGSPAQPADAGEDYRTVSAVPCSTGRRVRYGVVFLLLLLATIGPMEAALATLAFSHPALLAHLSAGDVLALAAVIFFGLLFAGLLVVSTVPRLLARALKPGTVYPLYGVHHALQRAIALTSNIPFLTSLFGDSSAIVYYLRLIGYRLGAVKQTGTNFGMEVKQDVPTLSGIGTGTIVSDGLTIVNAEFSSTTFRVMPTVIGAENFLGNNVRYPSGGRTGANCLLATKAMIPVSGPIREGVGLLGSPPFEIPRSVQRDSRFAHLSTGAERERRLAAKARHNAATMGLYLLVRYLYVVGLVLIASLAFGGQGWHRSFGVLATIVLDVAFPILLFVFVERAVTGFRPLEPRFCSIYQVEFWRHERFWKVRGAAYIAAFNGTPLKGLIWRLLGVDIGRRVFDDGCIIVERTLVSVGDDSTLNMGCELQSHSLEDGTFKSDRITVGADCTVGTGAWVCYGVTMEDGSTLDVDSFLMKGSHLSAGERWLGNPATAVPTHPALEGSRSRAPELLAS
jgi:non-ribosomal peptide synthetase-like protein